MGKRRAPLACPCFRSHSCKTLLFGVICLSYGRIQLMTSAGVVSLKFIIYLCRSLQFFFQAVCSYKRSRSVHLIEILYLLRDINVGGSVVPVPVLPGLITRIRSAQVPGPSVGCKVPGLSRGAGLLVISDTHVVILFRHFVFFKIDLVRNLVLVFHFSSPFQLNDFN